jgi:hypothetical protein
LEKWVETHPYFHNDHEDDVKVFAVSVNRKRICTEYCVNLEDKTFGFGDVVKFVDRVWFKVGPYMGIAYPNKKLRDGKIKVDLIQ